MPDVSGSWDEQNAKTSVQLYHEGRDHVWAIAQNRERPANRAYSDQLRHWGWITRSGHTRWDAPTLDILGDLMFDTYTPALIDQLNQPSPILDQLQLAIDPDDQPTEPIPRSMDWEA